MNKKIVSLISIIVLFFVFHIIFVFQIVYLKKSVRALESKTEIYEKNVQEFREHQDLQIEKINEGINSLLYRLEKNNADISNDIAKLEKKSDAQFSKTVVMSRTYDAILEEQKNKTIDMSEKDKAYLEAKKNAFTLFKNARYSESYEEYKKLTKTNAEDMECRSFKAKSLYYKNPADSSAYTEILEDIKILKQNAASDEQILEIEKVITAEKAGF